MILPYRLLATELHRNDALPLYLKYQKTLGKVQVNTLRAKYLNDCLKADLVPRFLRFRVPNNGCFDEKTIHEFQIKLLRKELIRAQNERKSLSAKLTDHRKVVKDTISENILVSIAFHSRINVRND